MGKINVIITPLKILGSHDQAMNRTRMNCYNNLTTQATIILTKVMLTYWSMSYLRCRYHLT